VHAAGDAVFHLHGVRIYTLVLAPPTSVALISLRGESAAPAPVRGKGVRRLRRLATRSQARLGSPRATRLLYGQADPSGFKELCRSAAQRPPPQLIGPRRYVVPAACHFVRMGRIPGFGQFSQNVCSTCSILSSNRTSVSPG